MWQSVITWEKKERKKRKKESQVMKFCFTKALGITRNVTPSCQQLLQCRPTSSLLFGRWAILTLSTEVKEWLVKAQPCLPPPFPEESVAGRTACHQECTCLHAVPQSFHLEMLPLESWAAVVQTEGAVPAARQRFNYAITGSLNYTAVTLWYTAVKSLKH